jgi:hypothetical protein
MTLVEKLREITEGLGWEFNYGRRDFQNLVQTKGAADQTVYFFLDPVSVRPEKDPQSGSRTGVIDNSGRFMIVTKADLDQVYDGQKGQDIQKGKWRRNIEPKLTIHFAVLEAVIDCSEDMIMATPTITDVIGVFGENMDGIMVNFSIKQI